MDVKVIREAGFADSSIEQWRAVAEKALRGASFDETLVSRTDDAIAYGPLYERREDARILARSDSASPWRIVQRVDDPDTDRAAVQAADDVASGATGLCLVFEGAPTAYGYGIKSDPEKLTQILDKVPLDGLHIRIDANPHSRTTAEWMLAALVKRGADPRTLQINFGIDPAAIFGGTGRLRMSIDALKASMPQSLSGFFAFGIPGLLLEADSRPYHNAGASIAQELGAMMATATSHLRMFQEARQPLVHAAPLIGFALSVDQDQLQSIAKIRALRLLWTRVQEACGAPATAAQIHAETSMRMMTRLDAETNILRATIAAFAAREAEIDRAGVDTSAIFYDATFGRALDYYTALVYEVTLPDGLVLIGGGRYDRLLTMVGATGDIPGVGFSVWLDRVGQLAGGAA